MIEYLYLLGKPFPIYFLFYILAFPCCVIFNACFYARKYHVRNMYSIFFTMLFLNIAYAVLILGSYFLNNVALHGINFVRVVGLMPAFFAIIAKISKLEINRTLDILTPTSTISNMIAHLGCIFPGCCHGFPIENYPKWLQWMGIYNNELEIYTFPIQIIECIGYGLIAVIIVLWANHKHYQTEGKAFPIYLILFGVFRFCMEFLRDNEKIAGPLSEFSFWCIAWIIEGTIWLIIKYINKQKKLNKKGDNYGKVI